MSRLVQIREQFEHIGGEFFTDVEQIARALQDVRVFLFDWDGVFNDGMKFGVQGSPFGEADSMGVNLLRLSYWLKHGKMPLTGIISGATNEVAKYYAEREGLEFCVRGFTDKGKAFTSLCDKLNIQPSEIAFVFDDVLDLPIAKQVAFRCRTRRDSGPLFSQYIRDRHLCDYLSAMPGGSHAVRECCELMIGLCFDFNTAVDVRCEYGPRYEEYLVLRKSGETLEITP